MKLFHSSILLIASFAIAGCAKTVSVQRGQMVPSATATAKVTTDDNQNAVVKLEVERLAPPENLTPPRKVYVVWAQTKESRTFLLGRLSLSKDGAGEFRSTVPVNKFRILVTAEDAPGVSEPSDQVVLSTDYIYAD